MKAHPWHPRVAPFLVYIALLTVVSSLHDWAPGTYPVTYAVQCSLVAWLLWRYRWLLPELTVRFDWLAVPTGVGVAVAWVWLGRVMIASFPDLGAEPGEGDFFKEMGFAVGWAAFSMRLVGMSVLVPLFEELFIRSLLLRSFHRLRMTGIGVIHLLLDVPVIGEWLMHTRLGERADRHQPVFGAEFSRTALGELSVFGVAASTFVFTIHHVPRDWPACVVCALAYCGLLRATRGKGLGPTCWAHGITNALLWGYTLYTGDWQFL